MRARSAKQQSSSRPALNTERTTRSSTRAPRRFTTSATYERATPTAIAASRSLLHPHERRTMSPPPGGQLSSAPSGSPRPRAAAMTSWLLEPRSRSPLRLAAAAVSRDSCGTRRTSGQRCVRRGESLRCVPPSVPRTSSYGGFNDAGFVPSSRSSRSEFGLGLTASVNRAGDSPRSSPRSLRHPSQWWRALSARAYGSRTP